MRKVIKPLLAVVLMAVLLFSGYQIYEIGGEYAYSETVLGDAVKKAVTTAAPESRAKTTAVFTAETDTPPDTPPITVDFDELLKTNPDIIGWLYCEGTPINYPVVQGDDNVFYLRHLYNGEQNRCGTLFLDCGCSPDFSDDNSVIYGHHMKNGSMFASIVEYRSQEYYDGHSAMYLLTPACNYRLDIFSGYVTDPVLERFKFNNEADFTQYIVDATEKSDFKAEVRVTLQDRLITLSTCTYEYEDARYVLHAVVKPIDG